MANMIIQENGQERTTAAVHGEEITIQAPCNCSAVSGVQIAGVAFPFYDAAGKVLPSGSGLFTEGSLIRVLIDAVNTRATILNHGIRTHSASGSYTGTGTCGSDNPNTLTFAFVPKAVMVMREGVVCFFINGCPYGYGLYTNPAGGSLYTVFQTVTWSDKTLSWYCSGCYASNDGGAYTITPSNQLNYNETYHYIAIG